MKITLLSKASSLTPILAQAQTSLSGGASSALGIVMLIGFIFGTICVIGGGFAIRRGDADTGKMSIIGGLIIAGAPVIVKALFTAFGIGRNVFPMAAQSYIAGGHVRTGLEDGVYLSRGQLAPSNAAMVATLRRIVEDLGGEICEPAETRDLLGLRAAD